MIDDEQATDGISDAADRMTQERAAHDQAAEQARLDELARRRMQDDPGDPRDRLAEGQQDRLFQQTTERELRG